MSGYCSSSHFGLSGLGGPDSVFGVDSTCAENSG
jgi:hypothetical protein